MPSIATYKRDLASSFRQAGLDTPDLDARLLLGHVTGLSREAMAAAPETLLTEAQADQLQALAERRLSGEPVAHLTGKKAFWSLDLKSDARALTPRPDTEIIVEAALEHLPRDKDARILDLGVGSGAILLALLGERPRATGLGVDISEDALNLARENAAALGLADRAAFLQGDWDKAIAERFDLIVSNPPYIPSRDLAGLSAETRADPALALDGGEDGLQAYRELAKRLPDRLKPDGVAVLELGMGQAADVQALMETSVKLALSDLRADLAGIDRAMVLRRVETPA